MNKQDLQYTWDMCLLSGWKRDTKVNAVAFAFVRQVNKDLLNGEYKDIANYITGLDLKRCMSADREGGIAFIGHKGERVRSFLFRRSVKLNACLLNENLNFLDILDSIDNFEWKITQSRDKDWRAKKQAERRNKGSTVFIQARELSGKNWPNVSEGCT